MGPPAVPASSGLRHAGSGHITGGRKPTAPSLRALQHETRAVGLGQQEVVEAVAIDVVHDVVERQRSGRIGHGPQQAVREQRFVTRRLAGRSGGQDRHRAFRGEQHELAPGAGVHVGERERDHVAFQRVGRRRGLGCELRSSRRAKVRAQLALLRLFVEAREHEVRSAVAVDVHVEQVGEADRLRQLQGHDLRAGLRLHGHGAADQREQHVAAAGHCFTSSS
jgi:hypothetical protein